jgi:hypothetical protein
VALYHCFIIITIIFVSHWHLLHSSSSMFIPSQRESLSSLAMLKLRTFSPLVDSKVSSFNYLESLLIHNNKLPKLCFKKCTLQLSVLISTNHLHDTIWNIFRIFMNRI